VMGVVRHRDFREFVSKLRAAAAHDIAAASMRAEDRERAAIERERAADESVRVLKERLQKEIEAANARERAAAERERAALERERASAERESEAMKVLGLSFSNHDDDFDSYGESDEYQSHGDC